MNQQHSLKKTAWVMLGIGFAAFLFSSGRWNCGVTAWIWPFACEEIAGRFPQQSDLPDGVRLAGGLTYTDAARQPRRDGVYAVRFPSAGAGHVADRLFRPFVSDLLVWFGGRNGA